MVRVKISTSLRLGDLHHHGYSNNHLVKVREKPWCEDPPTVLEAALAFLGGHLTDLIAELNTPLFI